MESLNVEIPLHCSDSNFNLGMNHLFDYIMFLGNLQSDSVGMSGEKLLEMGYTWMLYQLKIEVTKLPKVKEKIDIRTWISRDDKLKSYREVNFYDENGNLLVASTTIWLMIDVDNLKAVKIPKEVREAFPVEGNINFKEFKIFNQIDLLGDSKYIKVYKSDIDYNQHVNFAVQIRWIIDSIDFPNGKLKTVEVYYKNQIFLGDTVEIKSDEVEKNKFIHEVIANGKTCLYGLTTWEE